MEPDERAGLTCTFSKKKRVDLFATDQPQTYGREQAIVFGIADAPTERIRCNGHFKWLKIERTRIFVGIGPPFGYAPVLRGFCEAPIGRP